ADYLDTDSDNDGRSDAVEAQGASPVTASGNDANKDGIDDAFGSGLTPVNSDQDQVPDFLDTDSDGGA
nr:hypothetical protein [Gemmatimonadaceae bacterium]